MNFETQTEPKPKAKHQPHKEQPLSAADHPDAQLKADTVCALTGLGKSTLYKLARLKEFPTPIKRGLRCTRWRAGDVTDWLKAQAAGTPLTTSQQSPAVVSITADTKRPGRPRKEAQVAHA